VDGYVRQNAGEKMEWELMFARPIEVGQSIITRGIIFNFTILTLIMLNK
jgi:hypothetical protein